MKVNNNSEFAGAVLQTKDYSIFKALYGNRPVLEQREKTIRKSIEKNGLRYTVIIVNEKLEIIDGQGRFEVLKELGLPIRYIVVPGLTLDDCQVLNSATTSWKVQDYIDSFVARGNENYVRLDMLMKRHVNVPIRSILYTFTESLGNRSDDVKNGLVRCDEETFKRADAMLSYAERFLNEAVSGYKTYFLIAVMFCANVNGVDRKRLYDKWTKYGGSNTLQTHVVSVPDAVRMLEKIYNYKSTSHSVCYFTAEYDRRRRESNACAKSSHKNQNKAV